MVQKTGSIQIPDTFPVILKNYAKDMIRTQPFDILCWSASYFRCIASGIEPPTKSRFEEQLNTESHSLTKEFIKTLIKQLGRGYFLDRNVLQKRWKGLGLRENDLLAYLDICGMLHCDRIYWLRLLSVLVASISPDFATTIELLCETLSYDLEGGPGGIPFWMFSEIYSYLAPLDKNALTDIKNNCKIALEPEVISTHYFRHALWTEWQKYTKEPEEHPLDLNIKFGNAYDSIKQCIDFENLISLLKEVQYYIPPGNQVDTDDETMETKLDIVSELGAPWSWMYQFAVLSDFSNKSFNFIENASLNAKTITPISSFAMDHKSSLDSTHKCIGNDTSEIENLPEGNSFESAQENVDDNNTFNYDLPSMPGIGSAIPAENMHTFLYYIKQRAITENGMVFPRHFKEENCPKMSEV